MAKSRLPTPEELCQLLRYEPETGKLFWRDRPSSSFPTEGHARRWNGLWAGKEALASVSSHGYLRGKIWGRQVNSHSAIWAIIYGEWPAEVDHINGDRADNRLVNLRSVSRSENLKNCGIRRDNTSGVVGVSWDKRKGRWSASIFTAGKRRHLGYFDSAADAKAVRARAAKEYGFHPNHGARQSAASNS